jgi:hypothetical protein
LEVVVAESHFRGSGKTISTSHAEKKPYAPTKRIENADQDKKHVSSLTTPAEWMCGPCRFEALGPLSFLGYLFGQAKR